MRTVQGVLLRATEIFSWRVKSERPKAEALDKTGWEDGEALELPDGIA